MSTYSLPLRQKWKLTDTWICCTDVETLAKCSSVSVSGASERKSTTPERYRRMYSFSFQSIVWSRYICTQLGASGAQNASKEEERGSISIRIQKSVNLDDFENSFRPMVSDERLSVYLDKSDGELFAPLAFEALFPLHDPRRCSSSATCSSFEGSHHANHQPWRKTMRCNQ